MATIIQNSIKDIIFAFFSSFVANIKARDCGPLPFLLNGTAIGQRTVYPNEIIFNCDAGFNLVGSRIRRCQSTGIWSGKQTSCQGSNFSMIHSNINYYIFNTTENPIFYNSHQPMLFHPTWIKFIQSSPEHPSSPKLIQIPPLSPWVISIQPKSSQSTLILTNPCKICPGLPIPFHLSPHQSSLICSIFC